MTELQTNVLYYGDNLDILRRYVPDASVDLISARTRSAPSSQYRNRHD